MTLDKHKIKILIAEDNETDRLLLSSFVKRLGHEVVLACDGQEAVELFEKEQPHIILLDALMPRMSGFDAALSIKKLADKTLVPIIFLTSLSDAESLVMGLEAGGDDFLSKPYNHIILKAKIDAFNRMRVNHNHLQKALEDLKKSKNQLVQREKMASLGELVAGVAHEVNTPIGVSITAVSYLESELELLQKNYQEGLLTENKFKEFIGNVHESVEITQINLKRAATLINSFKHVAVDQANSKPRTIFLKSHVGEVISSLQHQFKRTQYQILVDCPEELACTCDAGALSHVISHLVANSLLHGFEGLDTGCISIVISLEGENIKLDYRDDGVGMTEERVKKVFDPFFTTKRGQGACGLGAHIVYNQVNQNLGGQVKVNSRPDEGTFYEVVFPQRIKEV